MKTFRKKKNQINEVDFALGQGNVGYGKNYHTLNPEPITWKNTTDLEYFVTTLPDGKCLAAVSLPGTDESTHTYEFNSEPEAMHWIKSVSDRFEIKKSNQ